MMKARVKGTCQACLKSFAVDDANAVARHGYKRPGDGREHGRCYGADQLPLELDKTICEAFLGDLRQWLPLAEAKLTAWKAAGVLQIVCSTRKYDQALGHTGYGRRSTVRQASIETPETFEGRPLHEAIELGAMHTVGPIAGDEEEDSTVSDEEQALRNERAYLRKLKLIELADEIRWIQKGIETREQILRDWAPKQLAGREEKRVRIEANKSGKYQLFDELDRPVKRKLSGSWRSPEPVVFGSEEAARRWAKEEGMQVISTFEAEASS